MSRSTKGCETGIDGTVLHLLDLKDSQVGLPAMKFEQWTIVRTEVSRGAVPSLGEQARLCEKVRIRHKQVRGRLPAPPVSG